MRHPVLAFLLCLSAPACSAVVTANAPEDAATQPADAASPTDALTAAPAALGECVDGARDPSDPILTLMHAGTALHVLADGGTRTLHRFAEGSSLQSEVQVRDGWTLLHVTHGTSPAYDHRVALLDPRGRVAWEEVFDVVQTNNPFARSFAPSSIYLGPQGRVALLLTAWSNSRNQSQTRVISPDGARFNLREYSPLAPPDALGRVLVRNAADDGRSTAWWTPASNALSPLAVADETVSPAWVIGDATVRYVTRPDGFYLSRDLDGREARVRLDFITELNQLYVRGADPEPWLLLSNSRDATEPVVHRLNLRTMGLETLRVQPPAGRFSAMYSRLGIDGDGALIGAFRDAEWGQLFRSADGQRWEPLGHPLTGVMATFVSGRAGGSYVLIGTNDRYGGDEWPETVRDEPEGLRGASLQIARPAEGVNLVVRTDTADRLSPPDVSLSQNGRCAAWVSHEDSRRILNVVRVSTGAISRVMFPDGDLRSYAGFAWQR